MKNIRKKAFTLVELLVVITIIAILAVVASQSFGGATSKAQNVVKKSNLAALKSTLLSFKNGGNGYYPMPQEKSETNVWGYDKAVNASISNTITVEYNNQEVKSIVSAAGGGKIYGLDTLSGKQIGAKWVLWRNGSFNKKFLKEDIYDTQLGDIKLTGEDDKKMIDFGIGKYVYAVYARPSDASNWNTSGTRGMYFEIATTIEDIDSEGFETLLMGDYTKDEFDSNIDSYPESLIWLKDGQKDNNVATTEADQWIPYPINNFAK